MNTLAETAYERVHPYARAQWHEEMATRLLTKGESHGRPIGRTGIEFGPGRAAMAEAERHASCARRIRYAHSTTLAHRGNAG